jgi:CRISPR-associated protein Csb1
VGLALIVMLAASEKYLREGCLLVPVEGKSAAPKIVDRMGHSKPFAATEPEALDFAQLAAADFGVGQEWTAHFDGDRVRSAATKKQEDKAKKASKAGKAK